MEQVHPLKTYRARHRPPLTVKRLAEHLGVSPAAVSRWETGERKPAEALVPGISAKTGIPAARLRPDLAGLFSPSSKERRSTRRVAA